MRLWISTVVVLLVTSLTQAQSVVLSEPDLVNSHFKIELAMDLAGKITVRQEGQTIHFKESAEARHEYLERILEAKEYLGLKAARLYQKAQAYIQVEGEVSKRVLRPEHALNLFLRKRADEKIQALSGKGSLTREDLELTQHFDTLAVAGLLPGKEMKVGDFWSITKPAAQALCQFDALIKHEFTCTLKEVNGSVAKVAVVGSAQGIDVGAEVNLLVEASYEFDLTRKCLTRLRWKQTEERKAGPVNPEIAATVDITLARTSIDAVKELNDFALAPFPNGAVPEQFKVVCRDHKGRYEFQHGRDWHVTSPAENPQLVLRLLDKGSFLAQATFTPMKKGMAGEVKTLKAFQDEMAETPGLDLDKILESKGDIGHPQKYTVHRVTAAGQQLGVDCYFAFYYLASADGDQMIVTLTTAPNQAQNLNGREEELIRSVVFSKK